MEKKKEVSGKVKKTGSVGVVEGGLENTIIENGSIIHQSTVNDIFYCDWEERERLKNDKGL